MPFIVILVYIILPNYLTFILVPASKQSTNLYNIYLMLCVQSQTPDDGRKDCPKHVEWYSINSKIVHLVGFTKEIFLIIIFMGLREMHCGMLAWKWLDASTVLLITSRLLPLAATPIHSSNSSIIIIPYNTILCYKLSANYVTTAPSGSHSDSFLKFLNNHHTIQYYIMLQIIC